MANKNIFCAVPWHNSHLYWDGTYGACCSEAHPPLGPRENISQTSMVQWYNSTAMQNFRLRILGDDPLPECQSCYQEEHHGHESRRIKENFKTAIFTEQAFEKSFQQSPWYEKFRESADNGTTDVLPIDLHLDFGNECNLACKMCFPRASSKIAQQYKKWGIDFQKQRNWINSDQDYENLLNSVRQLTKLKRIHVMGGEPLVNKRFFQFIDWLITNNYQHLSFSFVSNGVFVNQEIIQKLKYFSSVDIEISLESIKNNNHYIRQGSNTEVVIENIQRLCAHRTSTFNVVLRSVPQLLSVNTYYDYIMFAFTNRLSIQSIPLNNPSYLAIPVLPKAFRNALIPEYEKVKHKILNSSKQFATMTTGRDTSRLEIQLARECDSVIGLLLQPEPYDVDQLRHELVQWMSKWDKVYGLNACEFYPEWIKFFMDHGYAI